MTVVEDVFAVLFPVQMSLSESGWKRRTWARKVLGGVGALRGFQERPVSVVVKYLVVLVIR